VRRIHREASSLLAFALLRCLRLICCFGTQRFISHLLSRILMKPVSPGISRRSLVASSSRAKVTKPNPRLRLVERAIITTWSTTWPWQSKNCFSCRTSLGKPPTNSLQLLCSKMALLSSGLSTSTSAPPTSWSVSIEQSLAVDQSLSTHSAVDCVLSSSSMNLNLDSNLLLSRPCGRGIEISASIAGSCQISIVLAWQVTLVGE